MVVTMCHKWIRKSNAQMNTARLPKMLTGWPSQTTKVGVNRKQRVRYVDWWNRGVMSRSPSEYRRQSWSGVGALHERHARGGRPAGESHTGIPFVLVIGNLKVANRQPEGCNYGCPGSQPAGRPAVRFFPHGRTHNVSPVNFDGFDRVMNSDFHQSIAPTLCYRLLVSRGSKSITIQQ